VLAEAVYVSAGGKLGDEMSKAGMKRNRIKQAMWNLDFVDDLTLLSHSGLKNLYGTTLNQEQNSKCFTTFHQMKDEDQNLHLQHRVCNVLSSRNLENNTNHIEQNPDFHQQLCMTDSRDSLAR
jgi:uncharacterized pyridoxal phosphate-containing UPF0001 family protein